MQIADPTIALPFIKLGVETPGTKGAVDFGKTLMSGAVALPEDATAHLPVGEGVAVPNVVELVDGALPPLADMDAETLLVIPDGITAAGWPDEPGNLPGDVLYAWQLVAHSACRSSGRWHMGESGLRRSPWVPLLEIPVHDRRTPWCPAYPESHRHRAWFSYRPGLKRHLLWS